MERTEAELELQFFAVKNSDFKKRTLFDVHLLPVLYEILISVNKKIGIDAEMVLTIWQQSWSIFTTQLIM